MNQSSKFRWEKLGRVFLPNAENSPDWMVEYAQAPNAILLEDRIRIYFTTRTPRDTQGQYVSRVGYIDVDKKDPLMILSISKEPIIDLGKPGFFDEHGTYPFSVTKAQDKYIAVYGGWTRCSSVPFDVSLGLAVAGEKDLTFKKVGVGPLVTKSQYEPFVISSPKIRFFNGTYYLYYIAGSTWKAADKIDPVYSIRMAISDDGINWKKSNRNLITNVLGEFEAQASPDVFYFSGSYHMLFCYRDGTDFRNSSRGYRIGYAYSQDLENWVRDDTKSNLTKSDFGWDSEDISYPNVIEVDQYLYCFYIGNQVGRSGFGVARMKIRES